METKCLCAAWLSCAVWMDVRHRRIPNRLTVPAAAAGLLLAAVELGPAAGALFSLKGFGAGFCLFFIPFLMGGMGGGDVKLLAALGCWTGAAGIFTVFLYAALCGGVMSLAVIARNGGMPGLCVILGNLFFDLVSFRMPETGALHIPYALPVAFGYGVLVFNGPVL